MIKYYLEKVISKEDLSFEESFDAMDQIMSGNINNSQLSGFLTALKAKKETPEEIAGFTKAMRNKSIKVNTSTENLIDVCGTGGDYSGTFNISTATSFVVAGAGVRVAKHGNRSISSKCGSADVLNELGININLSAEKAGKALDEIGIAFLFAPNFHPAMKYAAAVRRELGIKTVFNMLGPLTNPAGTKKQLIGVFNKDASDILSKAAVYLDMEKVCFINTADKFDEISLTEPTDIFEYSYGKKSRTYQITNDTFNYPKISIDELKGDTPQHNAEIIMELLKERKKNSAFYVVAANAAMALYSADFSDNLAECKRAAEESILNGCAFAKLNELKSFGAKAA
ncbi:MAG: anthranilate phosphoribosyltransferase [Bacteroidota bacterium]|nr:anthranilate phosphoribosyltransferase [Bacteroidota bacterium]MDP4193679.1 anthranilate phosphoribosyltransferase [Bacteroidota bacterium]